MSETIMKNARVTASKPSETALEVHVVCDAKDPEAVRFFIDGLHLVPHYSCPEFETLYAAETMLRHFNAVFEGGRRNAKAEIRNVLGVKSNV